MTTHPYWADAPHLPRHAFLYSRELDELGGIADAPHIPSHRAEVSA